MEVHQFINPVKRGAKVVVHVLHCQTDCPGKLRTLFTCVCVCVCVCADPVAVLLE